MIKSTDFDVNIFLLWHLEVDRYIYYRQLRGKRRYSKGTSCNLYFGIFFMIIYFYFFQMFFDLSSSLEPLLFILGDRTNFFRATIQTWENYSVPKNGAYSAVFGCSQKHEQVNLDFSFKIWSSGYQNIVERTELYLKNIHGDFVCLWRLKNSKRH